MKHRQVSKVVVQEIMKLTDIEGLTRLSSEISHTRTDLTSSLSWQSIGLAN